jgi:hypothetical protein
MIDWLLKVSGKNNNQNNMERAELENLRRESTKLKKKAVNIG